MFQRKKRIRIRNPFLKRKKKYGVFDFLLDVISIPVVIILWVAERISNGIGRV